MFQNVGGFAMTTILTNMSGTNIIFQILIGSFKTNTDHIGVVMIVNEIRASASNWSSMSNTKMELKARIPYKKA